MKNAFTAAVNLLSGLGARIEEVTLPPLEDVWSQIASPILNTEAYT